LHPIVEEPAVKQFLIKYRRTNGSEEQWHQEIARFIAALADDAELRGRISYRCMKHRGGTDYYHIATVTDDSVNKLLQSRAFFTHYTGQTKLVSGGEVEVLPLEVVAETAPLP
jgi:hypothetical protein